MQPIPNKLLPWSVLEVPVCWVSSEKTEPKSKNTSGQEELEQVIEGPKLHSSHEKIALENGEVNFIFWSSSAEENSRQGA